MRALIIAFAVGLAFSASAQAAPLGPTSIPAANVVTVQGWPNWQWARRVDLAGAKSTNVVSIVGQLRHQEHEIRERISYAPPWERGGMEHHLWEVREQLRGECRGAWRDGE